MNAGMPGVEVAAGPRTLLVDDDFELLEELSDGLAALGLPSQTAATASEALDLVRQHRMGVRRIMATGSQQDLERHLDAACPK